MTVGLERSEVEARPPLAVDPLTVAIIADQQQASELYAMLRDEFDVFSFDRRLLRANGVRFIRGVADAAVLVLDDGDEEMLRGARVVIDVPLVVIVSRGDAAARTHMLALGAEEALSGPVDPDELRVRITTAVRRSGYQKSRDYRLGSLEIDIEAMEARRDGAPLALTPNEYRTLVILARRAEHVVTRSEIALALWGTTDSQRIENRLHTTISTLRAKLGSSPAPPWIRTARGAGYALTQRSR